MARKRGRSVRKAARKLVTTATRASHSVLVLRTDGGFALEARVNREIDAIAMRWSYRFRNRVRWRQDDETLEGLEFFARHDLAEIGVNFDALRRFVKAGFVEVSLPWREASAGETRAHLLPWEAILSIATQSLREGRPLVVIRHLQREKPSRLRRGHGRPLVVVSSPGAIGEDYDFEDERALILASLDSKEPEPITSPSLPDLADYVKRIRPSLIHLTGVDAHQGAVVLGLEEAEKVEDGAYLSSPDDDVPIVANAAKLAEALNAGAHSATLVTLNLYNSGARICPWIVAMGANTAIGFQDEVDDVVAERFFGDLYRAWRRSGFSVRRAFENALAQARLDSSAMRGSGIVLWTAESLVAEDDAVRGRAARLRTRDAFDRGVQLERERIIPVGRRADLGSIVKVFPIARKELNYALLHNDVDLFESFLFRKFQPGRLRDLAVEVKLVVGGETYPYKQSFELTKPVTDIRGLIRVPLTWDYMRAMRETTRSALYAEVKCGAQTLLTETFPVKLHPLEQWRDDPLENRYLASFVQPGDPAVAEIVERARPYLRALLDDSGASFDGYQSIDPKADDPYAWVDLQVQALWSAIAFDLDLAYTNPLATPGESSQRLRSPSEIVRSRFGTCIDLALLFAACLEFVEIYPLMFLIHGHSFPGYWRGDVLHQRFLQVEDGTDADLQKKQHALRAQRVAWMVERSGFSEIVRMVKTDQLVPLEATLLASRGSFGESTVMGSDNLRNEAEFESMIDVKLARTMGVNALPLWRLTN